MIIRILITSAVVMIGVACYFALRYTHTRRANGFRVETFPAIGGPAILYFRSDNCAPCVTQSHYLKLLEETHGEKISIMKIDADKEQQMAKEWSVLTLPTTFVIDSAGKVQKINYGLTTADKLSKQMERIE